MATNDCSSGWCQRMIARAAYLKESGSVRAAENNSPKTLESGSPITSM